MSLVPQWQEDGNNCLNPRQKSPAIDGAFLFQLEMKNILIILFISSTACSDFGNNPKEESELSENISFNSDIQPLLNASCINCHGSQGNLSERIIPHPPHTSNLLHTLHLARLRIRHESLLEILCRD